LKRRSLDFRRISLVTKTDLACSMTHRDPARIDLGPDEGLPDLLMRIKATRGDEVTVSFDDRSNLLLTASEFRQLRVTADQVRVNAILETNDPLRIQLASMFGFARVTRSDGDQGEQIGAHPEWPDPETRGGVSRSSLPIGTVMTSKPWKEEAVDASSGYSVPPRPIQRPEFALEPRTGAIQKQEPDSRARMRPSTIVGLVSALVALICVAAVLSIVLRTAEVVVKTPRQTISTDLVIGYSTDGSDVAGATITLPAKETEFSIPLVTTGIATGTLATNGGKASGTIDLRNISGKTVTIPSGTEIGLRDGIAYVTNAEVKLAKGDADQPTSAQVAITARTAGSNGNRDAGTFTGQITTFPGVYFSNLSGPLAGGNDNVIAVVTDGDLAAADAKARSTLTDMAKTYELPDGRVVVPSSVVASGDPSVEMDHASGDQVSTFNVSAQGTFKALTIDPNNLPKNLQEELRGTLTQSVPANYRLTDEPIRFAQPVEQSGNPGLMQVSASVDAAAILDQNTIDQIKDLAAGKSESDAKAALAAVPSVTIEDITVQPSLLIKSLPGSGRIEVRES
jgi:hypothetical protein